jgi:hypothetical protein
MEIINAVPKVIKDETVRINKYTILERKKCKLFYIHLFRHPLTTVHDQRDSFNIHLAQLTINIMKEHFINCVLSLPESKIWTE